jgi:hypothetical protein
MISHNDFQRLVDTNNPISQLLLSHYLAAHVLLHHISIYEITDSRSRTDPGPLYKIMMGWMHKIDAALPPDYKKYNEWPKSFTSRWAPVIATVKSGPGSVVTNHFLVTRKEAIQVCQSTL